MTINQIRWTTSTACKAASQIPSNEQSKNFLNPLIISSTRPMDKLLSGWKDKHFI